MTRCICHRCIRDHQITGPGGVLSLNLTMMICCPSCGNKRCPHASDHRLPCTRSNAPGQSGSIYRIAAELNPESPAP